MKVLLVVSAFFFAAALGLTAPPGTAVPNLPGYNNQPPLSMFSGYITVDDKAGRALHYFVIEAEKNPETAPLIFWYQGGPGCSGLSAMLEENGPFQPNHVGGLDYDTLGWTQFANMVWISQPAFVGYSYSNSTADHNTGDVKSTADNYVFTKRFIQAFPDYIGRDTYLTGESYGGEYVPTLTNAILSNTTTQIYKQFKGFIIGNPVFFCGSMQNPALQFDIYYWHGLISYTNKAAWDKNDCQTHPNSGPCTDIMNIATEQIGIIEQELKRKRTGVPIQPSIDPDCLYQDFCIGNGTLRTVETVPINCDANGARTSTYFNRLDVQQAMHVVGPNGGPPLKWTECTNNINYSETGDSMVPLYQNFHNQKPGVRIAVYSGDVDVATVPMWFTQPCLGEVQATNTKKWGPWYVNGQTAGYWEQFDLYTYLTVKGAGHEVPTYVPLSAFHAIQRWLFTDSLVDPSGQKPLIQSKAKDQGEALRRVTGRNF